VRRRVEAKTRRWGRVRRPQERARPPSCAKQRAQAKPGRAVAAAEPKANPFAPVAGAFFWPLVQRADRPIECVALAWRLCEVGLIAGAGARRSLARTRW
jgi:hypothetical protein